MTKEPKFWDCEGNERLIHTDINEAIAHYLDAFDGLPDEIEVQGHAPMELPSAETLADDILDYLLSNTVADYSDPEGSVGDDQTEAMESAAREFTEIFRNEYVVRACEVVCRKTINVRVWLEANRPDWLTTTV